MARQPLRVAKQLLLAAMRTREEQKAWDMWLALYPHMMLPSPYTQDREPLLRFMPFKRFLDKQTGQAAAAGPELSADEIIARAEAAKARHQQGRRSGS